MRFVGKEYLKEATLEIDGVKYEAHSARVTDTRIILHDQYVDLSIGLSFGNQLNLGGQQSFSTGGLARTVLPREEKFRNQVIGLPIFAHLMTDILQVFGTDVVWEKLTGKPVYALKTEHHGSIKGLAQWPEAYQFFLLEDLERMYPQLA